MVVRYRPQGAAEGPHLGLVGKAVTFDTGGIATGAAVVGQQCGIESRIVQMPADEQSRFTHERFVQAQCRQFLEAFLGILVLSPTR